jgi:outer membrane protein assembly factor BamE
MKKIIFIILHCFLLTSCLFYRPTIQQGNIITSEQVAQLKVGMTTDQVRYVMGTPILENTFNANRWDYIYTIKTHKKDIVEKQVTVFFVNGVVKDISK